MRNASICSHHQLQHLHVLVVRQSFNRCKHFLRGGQVTCKTQALLLEVDACLQLRWPLGVDG
jgi:hypothetical protein